MSDANTIALTYALYCAVNLVIGNVITIQCYKHNIKSMTAICTLQSIISMLLIIISVYLLHFFIHYSTEPNNELD